MTLNASMPKCPKPSRLRVGRGMRAGIVAGALLLYVAFFHAVYPVVGPATGAFYFSVVATFGWLFGTRGGLIGAAAALPVALVTYAVVAQPDAASVGLAGYVAATVANLILGYVSGRWSDASLKNHHQRIRLEAVERRHRMTVAATRDVIWEFDFKAGKAWYSDEFHQMTQHPEHQKPETFEAWQQLVHPEDRQRLAAEWAQAINGGNRGSVAYRLFRADGSLLHVVDRFFIERDEHDEPELAIGALADVTEQVQGLENQQSLREAEARERHLHQMGEFKSQLLNMASHELNTPISALRIQLYLLKQQMGASPAPEMARCYEILDRNTSRLGRLVADTLDVARIQNGRLSLRNEPCRISTVVEETLAAYGPVAAERNVTLTATMRHDPALDADAGRLTQVMFNLVSNAIKFAKASIHVNVCVEDADIVVAVRDDGLGIPPELQDRLFLPFSQLHESSTAANRGNGLGLYISRNIMELHGGSLGCASKGRGQGSTFTVRLPLTTPSMAPVGSAPAERLQAVAAK